MSKKENIRNKNINYGSQDSMVKLALILRILLITKEREKISRILIIIMQMIFLILLIRSITIIIAKVQTN